MKRRWEREGRRERGPIDDDAGGAAKTDGAA